MKMIILRVALLVLLSSGCTHSGEKVPSTDTKPEIEDLIADKEYLKAAVEEPVNTVSLQHFSNMETEDTFRLEVPQGRIFDTQSTLTITTSTGKVLFSQSFETYLLINGYSLPENATNADRISYIENRGRDFFKNSFGTPDDNGYISDDSTEFLDYEVWKEVKDIPGVRTFNFILGEEDINVLMYSPKLDKVVSVIACC